MKSVLEQLQQLKVDWQAMQDCSYVFQFFHQEKLVRLRLNDFPDEPLCTVIIEGTETDLHEFPELWTLPRHRGEHH